MCECRKVKKVWEQSFVDLHNKIIINVGINKQKTNIALYKDLITFPDCKELPFLAPLNMTVS